MKWFSYIALGVLLLGHGFAKAEDATPSDEAVKLSGFLPDACHFSADFSQSRQLQQLPVPLQSQGQLFFDCDLGLIWQTLEPVEESLVYSRSNLYFLVDKYKNIEALEGVQYYYFSRFLLSLLGGDTTFFTKNFYFVGGEEEKITLEPKNKRLKKAITRIAMGRQDQQFEFSLVDASGTETNISISRIETYDSLEKKQQQKVCQGLMGQYELVCSILTYPQRYESES